VVHGTELTREVEPVEFLLYLAGSPTGRLLLGARLKNDELVAGCMEPRGELRGSTQTRSLNPAITPSFTRSEVLSGANVVPPKCRKRPCVGRND